MRLPFLLLVGFALVILSTFVRAQDGASTRDDVHRLVRVQSGPIAANDGTLLMALVSDAPAGVQR